MREIVFQEAGNFLKQGSFPRPANNLGGGTGTLARTAIGIAAKIEGREGRKAKEGKQGLILIIINPNFGLKYIKNNGLMSL
jgi:hypothetical protein